MSCADRLAPNYCSSRRPFVQNSPRFSVGGLGAGQRNYQVHLRAAFENESDAAHHSVDVSESPESIEVDCLAVGCLLKQLFVVHHDALPSEARQHLHTTDEVSPLNSDCSISKVHDVAPLQHHKVYSVSNRELSAFRLDACFRGFCQRNDQRLDYIGQSRRGKSQPRCNNANAVLTAEKHGANDASGELYLGNSVKENLLRVMRINQVHSLISVNLRGAA